MSILVVNTGSSSLKFSLFEGASLKTRVSGLIDWKGARDIATVSLKISGKDETVGEEAINGCGAAIDFILSVLGRGNRDIRGVGHRVVHGGSRFSDAVLIDEDVRDVILTMSELAPLHNGPAIEAIDAMDKALPSVPQAALFDTAYYADMPQRSVVYPLPYDWYERWGIRRFGFHGINHAWCAVRAGQILLREISDLRMVSCHLGNGCSVTAACGGKAVATTMGFTPMEGLMMGSRSGSIDPGILVYLQKTKGLSVDQIDEALNHHSGLMGVSGVSSDFRKVEKAAAEGNARAELALALFTDRVEGAIASLAAVMKGIDLLVFTGGIGENAASFRERVCEDLHFLGISVNRRANSACASDAVISGEGSAVRVLVIRAGEERFIAEKTRALLNS